MSRIIWLLLAALGGAGVVKVARKFRARPTETPPCFGRYWPKGVNPRIGVEVAEACLDPESNKVELVMTDRRPEFELLGRPWANSHFTYIAEGDNFEPLSFGDKSYTAIEASSLAKALAIPGNSVYGYVDYLMNVGGYTDALEIAHVIAKEVLDDELSGWDTVGLPVESIEDMALAWRDSLAQRISAYVQEAGGIPFTPK